MVLPSCSPGPSPGATATSAEVAASSSQQLHVWVVGNPTSGGNRGGAVLDRLVRLFASTYGVAAVHTTSSRKFLGCLAPMQEQLLLSTAAASPAAHTPAAASAVSAVWDATAAHTTAPPSSSSTAACAGDVQTLVIRTDQVGHTAAVAHGLSRLILRSRLDNDRHRWRGSRTPAGPLSAHHHHHVVLIVGGDGTLSEATNGLCEGTLDSFAQLAQSGGGRAAPATPRRSSHDVAEREAAVLSHLLPAVLYVPGGTGSDFAKLGLCCRTADDALRVVRDGLVHDLIGRRACDGGGVAPSPSEPRRTAVAAHAVDVGRLEFLRTGTRHFFINECSTGMSCDVVRRGERFKRSRWIAMLGGLLLFAASALISLFLMKPTPLYICKLPPRRALPTTTTTAAAAAAGTTTRLPTATKTCEDVDDTDGGATETDASEDHAGRKHHPLGGSRDEDITDPRAPSPPSPPRTPPPPPSRATLSLAPFRSVGEQLDHLRTLLRCCDEEAASSVDEDGAYELHSRAPLPPPHARRVVCSLDTPPHQVLQLLDISPGELQRHRSQQQQQQQPLHNGRRSAGDLRGGDTLGVDDLAALTWVQLPSSMVAFANGRWYGGGMLVAPHADPMDGMLSCTNWVATILPFISGVISLYTGHHVRWRSTSAFDGHRFLITSVPPPSSTLSDDEDHIDSSGSGCGDGAPLYVEADGEVIEPAPAIVELAGTLTFLVPGTAEVHLGRPAPGTAREGEAHHAAAAAAGVFVASDTVYASLPHHRLRRLRDGLAGLLGRSTGYVQRWGGKRGRRRSQGSTHATAADVCV